MSRNTVLINPQSSPLVAGVMGTWTPDELSADHIQAWGTYHGDLRIQLTSGELLVLSFHTQGDRTKFVEELRRKKNRS